jgi:MFS family permease
VNGILSRHPPERVLTDTPDKTAINRFVLLYALAWAGGAIAYTPLLTILLPARVANLAGARAAIDWMAYIALAGAIAASLGSIGFGYLSDLTRNRRGWITAGLALSCALLIIIGQATSLAGLIAAIVCWQLALNMMLGPLSAWAGDLIPDHKKGILGGFLAFAPGLGALSGALVTQPGLAAGDTRIWIIAALVAVCVLPVLLLRPPSAPDLLRHSNQDSAEHGNQAREKRVQAYQMWLARLLVQVAEATMFAYLFLWLVSLDETASDNQAARLFSLVMLISAPLAVIAGRWSDRQHRPILPLQVCALGAALGLVAMAFASNLVSAMIAFGVFGLSGAIFLALHSAQTLRILPQPDRRGRDLGLFNLANTIPSLVMPWLAVGMVPVFGFHGLFLLLAVLAASASLLLRGVAGRRSSL